MNKLAKIPPGVGPKYPQVMILVGGTGDLAQRKLWPALFHLVPPGFHYRLPHHRRVARRYRRRGFRELVRGALEKFSPRKARSTTRGAAFAELLDYVPHGERRAGARAKPWRGPRAARREVRRLHYLSVPPNAALSGRPDARRSRPGPTSRVIMEKPFGVDLESAIALNRRLHEVFPEDQIFRIDHFLGKEPAQNILAFRFANGLFEPIWNRNFIDHVQIDVPETLGVGKRAAFLRADRRLPRHGGDASVPDPRLHGDGAADRARAESDQRGEEQGLPLDDADRPARRRARPIYRLSRRRTASIRNPTPRLSSRSNARSTTGAGPACRSSCAPASGWRRASASSRSRSASRRRACFPRIPASARRGRTI